jgi:outer membrane immunogenic protein
MRNLLSVSAVLLLGGSAFAADLPAFEPPPTVAPVPVFTWTGPYIGLQGGYAFGDAEVNFGLDNDSSFDPEGWLLGVFAGYNYQFANNVVIGIEGDAEWVDLDEEGRFDDIDVDFDGGIDWQGSLRGRLGYAFDRLLLHASAGFALASGGVDFGPDGDDDNSTEWGWTAGAGVDYAVTDNVFLRGEYRFTMYSEFDNDDDLGELQDLNTHAVRVGVGVKF